MREWFVPAGLAGLCLVALLLALALLRTRARTRRELAAAHAETAGLRAQVEQIERVLSAPSRRAAREAEEYHITALGLPAAPPPALPEQIDRALFADLVLRETVVRAASFAHGVRRALAPETRNRIRFEVRREIRRARKQRRADLKEARREWESRQRAAMDDSETAA